MARNTKLPDWFPLSTYSEDLSPGRWHAELLTRFVLKHAIQTQDEELTRTVFGDFSDWREIFLSVVTSGKLLEAGQAQWPYSGQPIRVPKVHELLFMAESAEVPNRTAVIKWARRAARGAPVDFDELIRMNAAADAQARSNATDLKEFLQHNNEALWPDDALDDDFVDITERYRKVTKPLVERTLTEDTISRLGQQLP